MDCAILQQDNTGRIRTLQGARFLFVVLIYLSHCVTPRTVHPFDFGGELGVAFFFTLSGFVLSWGYGPRVSRGEFKPKQFFWRHFWHFYPLNLLLFAVALALDLRAGHCYDWMQLASSLLLVQAWIPWNHTLYNVNAVSWFLCDIIFFYAIFKWLYGWIMGLRGFGWKFVAFAVAYCIAACNVPKDMVNCTLYANPLLRSVDFALGIVVYRQYKTRQLMTFSRKNARFELLAWLFAFWILYNAYQWLDGNGLRCAALFWPFVPTLVIALAVADGTRGVMARLLASRLMVWLGGISFEFFMVHLLAMRLTQHCIRFEATAEGDMEYYLVSFFVTVVLACVLHSCFVKPIAGTINRHLSRS